MSSESDLEDVVDWMKAEIFRLADVLEELNLELKQRIEAIEALETRNWPVVDAEKALPGLDRNTGRAIMQNDLGHPMGCGCVECKKARKREWYHKNKDRIKEQKRLRAPAGQVTGTIKNKKPEIIGLNRELHLRDESVNQFVTALTGFAQEAERCTGDPVRLSALREAARAAISEMSREAH